MDRIPQFVNPCAEKMLSMQASVLVGGTLATLERALAERVTDKERVAGQLLSLAAGRNGAEPLELTLDGAESRTLQARFFSIPGAAGDEPGLGLLLHDVTRERELDEMKSKLLSTVSHELRTPLASIKGFATTLLRRDVDWDELSRREFLSIIDEESDRLSELIANLLDMSRIEAGTLRVELEPTDLLPIIQETVAEFQVMTRIHRFGPTCPLFYRWSRQIRAAPGKSCATWWRMRSSTRRRAGRSASSLRRGQPWSRSA